MRFNLYIGIYALLGEAVYFGVRRVDGGAGGRASLFISCLPYAKHCYYSACLFALAI